jgi:glycosyltransferase involved in cell wall biosynthesis
MNLLAPCSFKSGFLSIVIPVGNDAEGLAITLASLDRQSLGRSRFEVIVVNDGAHASVSNVCRSHPSVREIVLEINVGSYGARNAGIQEGCGEYFGFMDANMEAHPLWCEKGMQALEACDYVGGQIEFSMHGRPRIHEWVQILQEFQAARFLEERHFAVTANLFVRRSVFEAAGLFDDRLRSSGDFEFGDRVYRLGLFRQGYCPEASSAHPLRSYGEMLRKQRRIFFGKKQLAVLFPERFSHFGMGPSRMLRLLAPPHPRRVAGRGRLIPSRAERLGCYLYEWANKYVIFWWCFLSVFQKTPYVDPPQKVFPS